MVEVNRDIEIIECQKIDENCDKALGNSNLSIFDREPVLEMQIKNLKQWVRLINEK